MFKKEHRHKYFQGFPEIFTTANYPSFFGQLLFSNETKKSWTYSKLISKPFKKVLLASYKYLFSQDWAYFTSFVLFLESVVLPPFLWKNSSENPEKITSMEPSFFYSIFYQKRTVSQVFSREYFKILQTAFLNNTFGRLLLTNDFYCYFRYVLLWFMVERCMGSYFPCFFYKRLQKVSLLFFQ